METEIRIRFWLQCLEKEENNLVLNSVRLTMNHSIVTDVCVTGDVSPQFLQTKLPLTSQLTPRTRVLRNLTNSQAVKFPTLYGIRKFIITFTRAHHLFLFRTRSIQSKPSFHFLKDRFNINFPPIIVTSSNFTSGFTTKIVYACSSPSACFISHPSHSSWFGHPSNVWRGVLTAPLYLVFSISLLFRAPVTLLSSSTSSSRTHLAYIPVSLWERPCFTPIKRTGKIIIHYVLILTWLADLTAAPVARRVFRITNLFVLATRRSPTLFEAFNQNVALWSTDLSWWSTALINRISIFDLPKVSCVVLLEVPAASTKIEESRRVDPFCFGLSHTC